MNNGYIVAKGNPIQIFKEEQNEYVKNFLNMSNYKIDENNHFYKILIWNKYNINYKDFINSLIKFWNFSSDILAVVVTSSCVKIWFFKPQA